MYYMLDSFRRTNYNICITLHNIDITLVFKLVMQVFLIIKHFGGNYSVGIFVERLNVIIQIL